MQNAGELMKAWYVVYTRANAEKRVLSDLTAMGMEGWLPSIEEVHRWTDRNKKIDRLIFPAYVFVRLTDTPANRASVLRISGVVRILGLAGRIESVPDCTIEALRRLIDSRSLLVIYPFLQSGAPVRVRRGPLAGLEGELVRIKNSTKLVITVELLSQSVAAEIDVSDVEPIAPRRRVA